MCVNSGKGNQTKQIVQLFAKKKHACNRDEKELLTVDHKGAHPQGLI